MQAVDMIPHSGEHAPAPKQPSLAVFGPAAQLMPSDAAPELRARQLLFSRVKGLARQGRLCQ